MALEDTRRENDKNVKKLQVIGFQAFAKLIKPTGQYNMFIC